MFLLFDQLTRPRVRLEKDVFSASKGIEDVSVEIRLGGSRHWLGHAWTNLFQPNLPALANRLMLIATSQIQQAYLLLRSYGKDRDYWDPISGVRQQIEVANAHSLHDDLDILIDISRDILKWMLVEKRAAADAIIDGWFSSGMRLLMRLAIHGVAEASHWDHDRKMKWLLDNHLLYNTALSLRCSSSSNDPIPKHLTVLERKP